MQDRARIAVLVSLTPAESSPPREVGQALASDVSARVASLPGRQVAGDLAVRAAQEGAPACASQLGLACAAHVAKTLGTPWALHLSIDRQTAERCRLEVSVVRPDAPATTAKKDVVCRLAALKESLDTLFAELPETRDLAAPARGTAPCRDACQGSERGCLGRTAIACEDRDWDGCLDRGETSCGAQGCTQGRCIEGRPEMVFVDEGPFRMGSQPADIDRALALCKAREYECVTSWWRAEQPAHWIQISGFFIDRTEVSVADYAGCVAARACREPDLAQCRSWDAKAARWVTGRPRESEWAAPDSPVVCVTFAEAERFCAWQGKRLPSEAQWERAARGLEDRVYPWGNTPYDGTRGNACDRRCGEIAGPGWRVEAPLDDGYRFVSPVTSHPEGASPHGAQHMAGNVWEWVSDWYDESYYRIAERKDPRGPKSGSDKVVRGGSWSNEPDSLRAAYRYPLPPQTRMTTVGFRCAYPP